MRRAALIALALMAVAGCKRRARPEQSWLIGTQAEPAPAPTPEPRGRPPEMLLMDVQREVANYVEMGLLGRDAIVEQVVTAHVDAPPGFNLKYAATRITDAALDEQRRREATWKGRTDCDRIDAAFAALLRRGILACGDCDVYDEEEVEKLLHGRRGVPRGFVTYDAAAVNEVLDEGDLGLEFGSFGHDDDDDDEAYDKANDAVAAEVVRALRAQKLHVEYDRDVDSVINVKDVTWHKRRFTKTPR